MPTTATTRVRYAETDQMGVVYHSHYQVYFEIGRTEAMRQLGITYAEIEERGLVLAVIETGMRFRAPAKYDDLLTIRTWLRAMSHTKMRFEYEITRGDTLLTTGFTVLAFLDRKAGMRPVRCPDDVERLARPHVESNKPAV